jgi:nitrogen regulatory protein PII
MQMHAKKRIEIIIEQPLVKRVLARLDAADVTGYSVVPIVAGRGHDGPWTAQGQVGEAGQMMAIICIADAAKLDAVFDNVFAVVTRQIGLVTVSDVAVVRGERF